MDKGPEGPSGSEVAIDSSNIGFKLLKKHGWKEGTGLGVSEQGRLEPVEAHWKNNKRGLGAEDVKQKPSKCLYAKQTSTTSDQKNKQEPPPKKSKALSKRMRKMLEFEKKLKEKEFERDFLMQFWPDNV